MTTTVMRKMKMKFQKDDSTDHLPFVVTYNPAIPRISNILRKHFNILLSSNRCRDVFKHPPFVACRRSANLRDVLEIVHSKTVPLMK